MSKLNQLDAFAQLIDPNHSPSLTDLTILASLALALGPTLLEAVEMLKMAAHALETPGDFSPEELETQVKGDISAFLAGLETDSDSDDDEGQPDIPSDPMVAKLAGIDARRMAWLEKMARRRGGILLHTGDAKDGQCGLNLAFPAFGNSLRIAIDRVSDLTP